MSPIRVTASRTFGRARNLLSTAFAVLGFLAVSSLFFAIRLATEEGGPLSVSVLWASCVAFVLPAFVALLAMDVWSEERHSGRIDSLLSLAVRERDFVLGKFLGVLVLTGVFTAVSLLSTLVLLWLCAPQALDGVGAGAWLLAYLAVFVPAVLWCAVSVALSALFRHSAAVVCSALVLIVALPRGIWASLMLWSSAGRPAFGEFPLDAHVVDIASGAIPAGTVAAYLVGTCCALFVASKFIAACRFSGRGALGLRVSTVAAVLLAIAVAVLACPVLGKANPVVDVPVFGMVPFSPRTRGILSESSGDLSITCFLSRNDVRFRSIGRLLRRLQHESESLGGARIALRFVDPRWDIGAAGRLVRSGVTAESLVFEKGRRTVALPIDDGYGERLCASTIRQISSPLQRRNVYWTVGHGEFAFDAYDAFGMSDIARELFREGFRNEKIDLAAAAQVPGDCALILIAGAKDDFSRAEIGRLDAYLKEGGRILVLLGSSASGGVVPMLPSWGVRPLNVPIKGTKTFSGSDVIVSDFADHPITSRLAGSRIVLERPVSFAPSAVVGTGAGGNVIDFRSVARVESAVLVATAERGGSVGQDVALRPTRIVVIGDAGFALNGALASRASANRDFFSNCVAYLAGVETHGAGGDGASGVLRTGMDRQGRLRHALWSALVLPAAAFLFLATVVFRRRRRT